MGQQPLRRPVGGQLHLLALGGGGRDGGGADALRESGRPLKPEFEGYTKVRVAIDAGAAASVMPERLLAGHT
eukprot:15482604-Alexandrium_andersonii.AAC.1